EPARKGERAPVNWYGHARREERGGLSRAGWIEMAGAQRRTPAPDGQKREVERPAHRRHAVEDVRVSGEVHGSRPVHHEADRLGGRAKRPSVRAVRARDSFNPKVANLCLVSRPDPDT